MGASDNGSIAQLSDFVVGIGAGAGATRTSQEFNFIGNEGLNAIVVTDASGAAATATTITLEQCQDAAGTGAKALQIKSVESKIAADGAFSPATDIWADATAISRETPANDFVIADTDQAAVVNIFVLPQDLDVANGFSHVRVKLVSASTAVVSQVFFVPTGRQYKGVKANSSLA